MDKIKKTSKRLASEAWWMLPDDCKKIMAEIKSAYISSLFTDIYFSINEILEEKFNEIINNKKYTTEDMKSFADWCRCALLNSEYSYKKLDKHLSDWEKLTTKNNQ
jgi:hypothetical protein